MRYLKFLILLVVLIPLRVYGIELYCDRYVKSGKKFTCVVSNNSNSLYELKANLSYSKELVLSNQKYSKGYTSNNNENSMFISGPGFNAPTTIVILEFTAPIVNNNQNYQIYFKDIEYKFLSTDTYYKIASDLYSVITVQKEENKTETTTTTTKPIQNNEYILTLNNLDDDKKEEVKCTNIDGKCIVDLSKYMDNKKEGYKLTGYSETLDCSVLVSNSYEMNKNMDLYACFKKITSKEVINYLSALSIDGYDIDFNKFKFEYTIDVPKDVTRLEVNAVANSETGKVVISKNAQELVNSTNEIEVDVIDNDFITTYVIKVNKEEETSKPGQPMLKNNIMIDGKIIDNFSSNNFSYVVTVDYGVKNLDILTNSDDNIKVSIVGNDNLKNNSVIYIYASNEEFVNT